MVQFVFSLCMSSLCMSSLCMSSLSVCLLSLYVISLYVISLYLLSQYLSYLVMLCIFCSLNFVSIRYQYLCLLYMQYRVAFIDSNEQKFAVLNVEQLNCSFNVLLKHKFDLTTNFPARPPDRVYTTGISICLSSVFCACNR